jgi:Arc/MetJ-type ribon-helix-helix transcriptional regulator
MNVQLQKPDLERFIDEQVRAGNFPTPEAVVETALQLLMEESELTAEDLSAIEESDRQFERGEFVDFKDFAARMRKKYGIT